MIDLLSEIKRLANMDSNETYNQGNNSLEAIANLFVPGSGVFDSFLQEQISIPVSINAIAGSGTDFVNLPNSGFRYVIRSLRLKCADPGVNIVTVNLYELVNGFEETVDSFDITTANFANFFDLPDMFGVDQLAGQKLRIGVIASAGGPYAVTGQVNWAQTLT